MGYLTVVCPECDSIYRAYRVVSHPLQEVATINYCMHCGHTPVSIHQDEDMDYLDVLSHHIGKTPTMTKKLLTLWRMEVDEARHEHRPPQTFSAYMAELHKTIDKIEGSTIS